jgi:hypothetical protein
VTKEEVWQQNQNLTLYYIRFVFHKPYILLLNSKFEDDTRRDIAVIGWDTALELMEKYDAAFIAEVFVFDNGKMYIDYIYPSDTDMTSLDGDAIDAIEAIWVTKPPVERDIVIYQSLNELIW